LSNFYSNEGKIDIADNSANYIELGYKSEEKSLSIKVSVENGNNLFSYIYNEDELIYYDKSTPLASFACGNPILFPFPNRIKDAMWTWKGKTHLQKKNGIPIQLHSLVYDETSFEYLAPKIDNDSITLKTFISVDESHPIFKGYPYCFKLWINYVLKSDGLKIEYLLENLSDEEMPYGIAFHPYFNKLSGDHYTKIKVPCEYHYELKNDVDPEFFNKVPDGFGMTGNVLPTGNLLKASDTEFDILSLKSVGNLNLDTVYTNLNNNPVSEIDYQDKDFKMEISCSEEFKHYVVYTPQDKPFFCIEPQTCSTDAINLYSQGIEHVGLLTCNPSGTRKGFIKYAIK